MYNITSTPADASTYYKVVHLVTLQHENMNFSPTASSMGGVGPSPSDGAGAAYADPKNYQVDYLIVSWCVRRRTCYIINGTYLT